MAIDDIPEQKPLPVEPAGNTGYGIKFVVIFLVLAALAIGEFYTAHKMNSLRDEQVNQQNQLRKDLTAQIQDQVLTRLTALEHQNAQQLEAVKAEADQTAKRTGSQGSELKRARALVTQLEDQQRQHDVELKQQLAEKADQKQLGALTNDVSSTKTDLDTTKKAVSSLAADLGMARSDLGTLIARNHDDIEYLRKQGERDYFEFKLAKNSPTHIAGVGLNLTKTNAKRYRFSVAITADDKQVEKKDRTINEPIFFYVNGTKKPFELVVNSVESTEVKGYISTPKGAAEVAARPEGTR
jgi:hypothetical protein